MSNNIIQGGPIPKKDYYKVYVRSCTYNQSQYIEDCLNGVALQKTDFPFVHHVIDDCSTDGEQEVIKAWIERECDLETAEYYDNDICTITLAKNKSNPNCTLVAYFLKRNMYRERAEKEKLYTLWREACPYEAICEGDDYWIAPKKLQEQVDWMNQHPSCGLVYTKAQAYIVKSQKKGEVGGLQADFKQLLHKNTIWTLTTLFRTDCLIGYYDFVKGQKWLMGDKPLWLYISHYYEIHCLNMISSIYRVLENSASQRTNLQQREDFLKCSYNVQLFFAQHFLPEEIPLIKEEMNLALYNNSMVYRNISSMNFYFVSGGRKNPNYFYHYINVIKTFFKKMIS